MTLLLFQVIVTQFFLLKVTSSYMHQYSPKPYVIRESPIPQKAYIAEHVAYQNHPPAYAYPAYKISEPPIAVLPPKPIPKPEPPIIKTVPTSIDLPAKCPSNLDAHVLNNLAIALQLLIVNNIISNPPDPNHFSPLTDTVLELALPNKFQNQEFQMPNSKFLGSSGFGADMMGNPMMGPVAITPRAGTMLMSPYDAIAKSLPASDPYSPSYVSKRDFQSPYATIMAADNIKDLFSMSDYY